MNDKNSVKEFEDPYRVKTKPRVLREAARTEICIRIT